MSFLSNLVNRTAGPLTNLVGRLDRPGDILSRFYKPGLYMGAGYGVSALIQHDVRGKKAYYGESRYQSLYGSGGESAAGLAKTAGMWYGGWSMFHKDPISRAVSSARYWGGERSVMMMKGTSAAQAARIRSTPRIGIISGPGRDAGIMANILSRGAGVARLTFAAGLFGGIPKDYQAAMMGGAMVGGFAAGIGSSTRAGFSSAISAASPAERIAMRQESSMLGGFAGSAAVVAGAAYGGYLAGSRNNNPIAEGNITSMGQGSSVTSRLNYSTAGLTLALHNNRRM